MAKPLPKTILKPRTNDAGILKSNNLSLSRSRSLGLTESLVHLGDGVYWDLNQVANPHMVILGTSGSGKTQTLKAIAWEMYRGFASRSIVLDFHGDRELPGEVCYPLNMASPYGINPLTINPDPEGGGPKLQAFAKRRLRRIAVAANLRRSLLLGVNSDLTQPIFDFVEKPRTPN